jgi:NADH-quinone oxidoreductase subunit N
MLVGNILAIKQNSLKRMLAYSSIAQAGYILIGFVALLSSSEIKDAVYNSSVMVAYIFGYMFTNLAAFYSMGAIKQNLETYDFNQFKGFGRIDVLNSFVLSISMLSLIGIPPTIGFITKLFLFSSGINSGFTWLVIFGLINTVISAYYYLRIIKVLYLEKSEFSFDNQLQAIKVSKLAVLLLISIVVFGVYPDPIFDFCYDAINSVIN